MKMPKGTVRTYEDRLVRRYLDLDHTLASVGKRVPASCPISHDERKIYVKQGAVAAVAAVKRNHNVSLSEAFALLNQARGVTVGRNRWKFVNRETDHA